MIAATTCIVLFMLISCIYDAAAPKINIPKNTRNTIVIIAKILPRQPHFLSPSGNLSDSRQIIKPINGVNRTDKKKVQPNPILLLAPTNPTSAARNVLVSNPKNRSVKPIVLYFGAKIIMFPLFQKPNVLTECVGVSHGRRKKNWGVSCFETVRVYFWRTKIEQV